MPSGTDPLRFFTSLPTIFPYEKTLFFEGPEVSLTAKALYNEYPARYVKRVLCDTLIPAPESFDVCFEQDFSERLCQLIAQQGMSATFFHFKGYSETELIFSFHTYADAFDSDLVISENVSEIAINEFAQKLGQNADLTYFPSNQFEKLKKVDAIINPSWLRKMKESFARMFRRSTDQKPK